MARTLTLIGSTMVLLGAPAGSATRPRASRIEQLLLDAHSSNDAVDLARAAERAGTSNILRLLRRAGGTTTDRATLLAAIAAAPHTPRGWTLITPLMALATTGREAVALAALAAVTDIAEGLEASELREHEHPLSLLDEPRAQLLQIARDDAAPPRHRAAAIRALVALDPLRPLPRASRIQLLAVTEARVRREAVELFANAEATNRRTLATMIAEDTSAPVARAAAAALCSEADASRNGAAHAVAALRHAKATPRLHMMVSDEDATRDELIDIDRCLATMRHRADRVARARLRARLRHWKQQPQRALHQPAAPSENSAATATPGAIR